MEGGLERGPSRLHSAGLGSRDGAHRTMALGTNREGGTVTQPKSCLLGLRFRLFIFIIKVIVHVIDYLEIAVKSKQK